MGSYVIFRLRILARYCRSLPVGGGWYLVFVPNHLDLERLRVKEVEKRREGMVIHTLLVLYDEERDFGEQAHFTRTSQNRTS